MPEKAELLEDIKKIASLNIELDLKMALDLFEKK